MMTIIIFIVMGIALTNLFRKIRWIKLNHYHNKFYKFLVYLGEVVVVIWVFLLVNQVIGWSLVVLPLCFLGTRKIKPLDYDQRFSR